MLQVLAFFAAFIAPAALFAIYLVLIKKWTFRKLIPYGVIYCGAFGALLAWGLNLKGWDFAIGVALSLLIALIAMTSWARLLDSALASKRR